MNKLFLILILGIFLIFSFGIVGALPDKSCYQESANFSNQTGTDNCLETQYTGTYVNGSNWYNGAGQEVDKTYDGIWGTYSYAKPNFDAFVLVNYTKPLSSSYKLGSVIWEYGGNGVKKNATLLNSCINYDSEKIILRYWSSNIVSSENVSVDCYDGSWKGLSLITIPAGNMYEEGIYWNLTYDYSTINLSTPLNNSKFVTNLITFNCSAGGNRMINNISLWINGVRNYTLDDGIDNFTSLQITRNLKVGSYNWSCSAEDNLSQVVNSSYRFFDIVNFIENSMSYNITTYETAKETFIINITTNGSIPTANFYYNGTNLGSATRTSYSDNNYIFKYTKGINNINSLSQINNFSFFINIGDEVNSSQYNHSVNRIMLGLCNTSLTSSYINFTFKDEGNLSNVLASIPSSTITYWLGDGVINKTLLYSNNQENLSYGFCFTPQNRTLNTSISLQYQSTDYPQRIYTDSLSLTNISLNKTLYLLGTSDGIYVTFQVLSAGNEPINGVAVVGTRDISGTTTIVAQGTTDSAGTITFWLNPDYLHTFNFSKSGYATYETSIYPTQSTYTLTLGGESTYSNLDYTRGIKMVVLPSDNSIKNGTVNFNFTISTTYWTLDGFGFVLKYSNGTSIGSQSSSSDTGGFLDLNVDVPKSGRILMNYYYIVNSTYMNYTRYWNIYSSNDFSITHFFEDLSLYIGANIFGINGDEGNADFGKALISVFILIMVAGSLSYRYGLNSEQAVMGMIFGLVLILNSLNFIPNPTFMENAVLSLGDLITFLIMLITIGFIIKGEQK